MGAIFTSQRNLLSSKQLFYRMDRFSSGGALLSTTYPLGQGRSAYRDSQVTTSYRSRGRVGDVEVAPSSGGKATTSFDNGHEFSTTKVVKRLGFVGTQEIVTTSAYPTSGYYRHRYNTLMPGIKYLHNGAWRYADENPDPSWFITSNDVASGKQSIAACAPTRPEASLSVDLAEIIREGIPSIIGASLLKDRVGALRGLGSEYLNVQFGWLPLVSSIMKMISSLSRASEIITQMERDSGRIVRRRFVLPELSRSLIFNGSSVDKSLVSVAAYGPPAYYSLSTDAAGVSADLSRTSVSVTAHQNRWFAGAFTYLLAPDRGFIDKVTRYEQLANKLLGTRITPETLWNLAPWSWLVDWVADVQSHFSVASLFQNDGLVLQYGYLMVKDRVVVSTDTYLAHSPVYGGGLKYVPAFSQVVYERKRRVKSTPFGFGLNPSSDFTSRQWSILAALGMTKAPRILR